jgi:hypothetical protein
LCCAIRSLRLVVHANVKIGVTVYATGEGDALGNWDLDHAVQLVTTPEA